MDLDPNSLKESLTWYMLLCDIIIISHYPASSKESDEIKQSNGSSIPPSTWTEPHAVLYQGFDSSDCPILMEGTQPAEKNCASRVWKGKVH